MNQKAHRYHNAVIMATDIVGYSAMLKKDEQSTLSLLNNLKETLERLAEKYHGKTLKYQGDKSVSIFESGEEALTCAFQLQKAFHQAPKLPLTIGVDIGKINFLNENIYGDGLDMTIHYRDAGSVGSVLFSKKVAERIEASSILKYEIIGELKFKGYQDVISVFALSNQGLVIPTKESIREKGLLEDEVLVGANAKWSNLWWLMLVPLFFAAWMYLKSETKEKEKVLTPISKIKNQKASIAILPFQVFSSLNQDLGLGKGMTEDVLMQLSNIADLKIISLNSSKRYVDTTLSVKEIGESLNVDHLLQGSIRETGERYRISIQLINTLTDEYIWSNQYNLQGKDIFSTQSRIAIEVADALETKLHPEEKERIELKPTDNIEAYQLYSRARFLWNDRSDVNMKKAISLLQKAIQLDANFALGYAGLSQAYTIASVYRYVDVETAHQKAKQFAEESIALNKNLAEGYVAMGGLERYFNGDYASAVKYLRKAIALKPNYAMAHHWLGYNYINLGWNDLAKKEIAISRDLDPYLVPVKVLDAELVFENGELDKAEKMLVDILDESPGFSSTRMFLTDVYISKKNKAAALETALGFPEELQQKEYASYVHARLGDPKTARELVEEVKALSIKEYGSDIKSNRFVANVLAAENKMDELFDFLNEIIETDKKELNWLIRFPLQDEVLKDTRYSEILKKANLLIDQKD